MAKLIFFCGKMAAGKSTLAKELAARERAVLLNQDQLIERLFPGEVIDVPSYIKYSSRLNSAIGPHVSALLALGTSVVLDFPGNTRSQRAWFRELFEKGGADHELHFIDAPDALCKRQLKERSKDLPPGTPWTSEAEFDLTLQIYKIVKARKLTQARAAEPLGIKQPHVSLLMRNRSGSFSVERLMEFLTDLGHDIEIRVKPTRKHHGQVSVFVAA